ncbi:MAG: tetratricopeptide repeat protein [Acidobacteriota bacterium]
MRVCLAILVLIVSFSPWADAQEVDPFSGWSEVSSSDFALLTNASPERGRDLLLRLERFRSLFARLSPDLELDSAVPLRILAFRDAEAYAPYKNGSDGGGLRIMGQFIRSRDGAFITLDADPGRRGALSAVYHEAVHDLVAHNFPAVPRWLDEGLAEYYGAFEERAGFARVGSPVERHLDWLQSETDLDLPAVLSVADRRDLHGAGGARRRVGRFYAVSWALVHYLLSQPEGTATLGDYLLRLLAGEDPNDALEESLGRSVAELEKDLVAYLQRREFASLVVAIEDLPVPAQVAVRAVDRSEVAVHLGDLLLLVGRRDLAAEHYDVALEGDPGNGEAWSGLAWIQDSQGSYEEAEVLHRKALEAGSREALTFVRLGRHRSVQKDADGARWAFAEAVARDPSFAEARALLGRSQGLPGGDPVAGIRHLKIAMVALPYRLDLAFDLVRLHLANGDPEAAERLLDGTLSRYGDAAKLDAARREVERTRQMLAYERALAAGDRSAALAAFDRAISVTDDSELKARMEAHLRALQRDAGR